MKLNSVLLSAFVILISGFAQAHPVSFKNGYGIMSYNSSDMTEVLLTYSFTPKFAAAYTYLRDSSSEFNIPRADFLLKRWNNPDSQGNIYLSAGSGIERYKLESSSAHLGEVVMDWESREYYTYLEHLFIKRNNDKNRDLETENFNNTKLRFGFAPFLADYEDLNIWLIAQFQKTNNENISTTQFLRFYRKNVLWEVGAGFDGSIAFNFMIHL